MKLSHYRTANSSCGKSIQIFPSFYGTRRFITVFTAARHLSLSWAISLRFMRSPRISLSIILMWFCLCLGLPNGLLHPRFPPKFCTYFCLRYSNNHHYFHAQSISWFVYYKVLCCAVLCCAVLCGAVLCCAVLCCAVRCCAVLQKLRSSFLFFYF